VEVPLQRETIDAGLRLTEDGVRLAGRLETVDLPVPGTRALALFVVNGRETGEKGRGKRAAQGGFRLASEESTGKVPGLRWALKAAQLTL